LSSNAKGVYEIDVRLQPGSVGTSGFGWATGPYGKSEEFSTNVNEGLISQWAERYGLPAGEDTKYHGRKYRNTPPSGAEITQWEWGNVNLTILPKQLARAGTLAKASPGKK
jgi:hypothetical protein